jgi:hypothetical protein
MQFNHFFKVLPHSGKWFPEEERFCPFFLYFYLPEFLFDDMSEKTVLPHPVYAFSVLGE